jgi:hypothetical protein
MGGCSDSAGGKGKDAARRPVKASVQQSMMDDSTSGIVPLFGMGLLVLIIVAIISLAF